MTVGMHASLSSGASMIVQIDCQINTGCLGLIGGQLDVLPDGAVIQIGAGIYYEHPFAINKNLTIEGTGELRPDIRFVDSGRAISISPEDETIGVNVTLRNLIITTSVAIPGEFAGDNTGIDISGLVSSNTIEVNSVDAKTQVTLDNMEITSFQALRSTFAKLSIKNSLFKHRGIGMSLKKSEVGISSSSVRNERGTIFPLAIGVVAQDTKLGIADSSIQAGYFGLNLVGDANYLISNSSFSQSDIAISLSGDFHAELQGNRFALIEDTAIQLHLASCVDNPQSNMDFTLTGSSNTFEFSNGVFICPADYPLPEGFLAEGE